MPVTTFTSFLGVAKETTPGTAVAATDFLPVTALSPQDNITMVEDTAWRGSAVSAYNTVGAAISADLSFSSNVYPSTIGWLLGSILGDVTTTGASAPFTHAFAVKNNSGFQPTSLTFTDYNGFNARQYAGAKVSELNFKFSADKLLTFDAKASAYGSATASTPTPSFSTDVPWAGWVPTVTIGGSARTTSNFLLDGEVDIKRNVDVINGVTGTQNPSAIRGADVSVSGKLTMVYEDDTDVVLFRNNTTTSLVVDFTTGASTELKLAMSNVKYTAAPIDRSGNYVKVSVSFTAYANTTDVGASAGFSPIKATLKNAVPAGTYQ